MAFGVLVCGKISQDLAPPLPSHLRAVPVGRQYGATVARTVGMLVRVVGTLPHPIAQGIAVHARPVLAAEGVAGAPDERTAGGRFVRSVLAVDHAIALLVRLDALAARTLPLVVVAHFPTIAPVR